MKNLMILICLIFVTFNSNRLNAQTPLTNTFTYQGELKFNNALANGSFDFEFSVFDVETNGTVLETVTVTGITVTNGVFTTPITLTMDLFTGNKIWLDIGVRAGGAADPFDPLSPRQAVTSSPYAIHAQFVGADAVTGTQIFDGTITANDINTASVQVQVSGVCASGFYMQSINADGTVNCTVDNDTVAPAAWELGGNSASAGDFIGTTNGESFVIKVNSKQVLSLQNNIDTNSGNHAPNIIMGADNNSMSGVFYGSTISGGASNATRENNIYSTIGGGASNIARGLYSTIGGGASNTVSGITSTIIGGNANRATARSSTVGGGGSNTAGGEYSFAAGFNANVRSSVVTGDLNGDEGTFVWSDSTATFTSQFISTGPNQFLIRASGGVGIGTNSPNGYQLNVSGDTNIQGELDISSITRIPSSSGGLAIGTSTLNGFRLNVVGNTKIQGNINISGNAYMSAATSGLAIGTFTTNNNALNILGSSYFRNNTDTNIAADLVLGGGGANSTDDGVLTSDLTQSSSDLLMKSNGDVVITLDDNDDETGLFQILGGLGNTLLQLSETGGTYFEVTGSGLSPPGFHIEQQGASGVGMLIRQTSSDANLVLTNKGTGDLIKAFTGSGGGNLMFRVAGNGNVTADGTISGGGADFAEYLPTDETDLQAAEVVGLNNGKLSRDTSHAQRVMVISTNPAFIGNSKDSSGKALAAFMGQVHVKVKGTVQAGDWLIASGNNDGKAIAISNNQIATANFALILGRAIANSHNGQVKALVGLPQQTLIAVQQQTILQLQQQQNVILAQLKDTQSLRQELAEIKSLLLSSAQQSLLAQNNIENKDE